MSTSSTPSTTFDWEPLRGARVLVTGGTGFFGRWLLGALLDADRSGLTGGVDVLTRAPRRVHDGRLWPLVGDVRTFRTRVTYDYVLHMANDLSWTAADHLEAAKRVSDLGPGLFTSSGAVYSHDSTYADGKRSAEGVLSHFKVARCFSVIGRGLSTRYAAGAFIRDADHGGPVRVTDDGSSVRSYLHGADLATWLWTILLRGDCEPYDVGSPHEVTVGEFARMVARASGTGVAFGKDTVPDRYVPDVRRATAFGLRVTVPLEEAIWRTLHQPTLATSPHAPIRGSDASVVP